MAMLRQAKQNEEKIPNDRMVILEQGQLNANYAKPSSSDPAGRFSKVQRGDFEKPEDSSGAAR